MSRFVKPAEAPPEAPPPRRSYTAPPPQAVPAPTPPKRPRPGPSVYDTRGEAVRHELPTHTVNIMGQLVEVPVCCANPAECQREECWTPLATGLDGFSGLR